jgi:pimeloyl-ACP methyl ester carboxylesterase
MSSVRWVAVTQRPAYDVLEGDTPMDALRKMRAGLLTLCLACMPALVLRAQSDIELPAHAPADVKPGSITYEDVPYPYPVSYLPLRLYGQDVRMAYMDVPPAGQPNGRTAVLLHGMNFGGFYWGGPIDVLRKEGFRVVVPDQIGFARSSKPVIPYNFHDMALNTRKLLESLHISRAVIIGHSMGGMLAARFAASYPDITERVVLYDPIGLTDVRWERPWRSADEGYEAAMTQSGDETYRQLYSTIRHYFPSPGAWKPEFEEIARLHYARRLSADWPRLAMVRAIYQQMPVLDPVVYDWAHIKVKALVIGGEKDGQDFPIHARHIAETIPGAQLVIVPNAGHVLHLETPDVFYKELLKFLRSDAPNATQSARGTR